MATFTVSGFDGVRISMEEIAQIPENVQSEILNKQADLAVQAIRERGLALGVHRTGETLAHLRKGKVKRDKNGDLCIYVTFNGKNSRGTRYAEIAFINNYGKRNQAARPFVTDGVASIEKQAQDIAVSTYDEWLQSKNL